MALSLTGLNRKSRNDPPRVLLYGPPGLGKTNLAAEFPNPILLDVEGGRPADVPAETVPGFDPTTLTDYESVMSALEALYTEDHDFQTVIFDTLDRFEPLLWRRVCDDNKWDSIESPGYGKGYVEADRYWRDLLDAFNALRRDRRMSIVLVAHSAIERFDDPTTASYSRYDIRLHKRASAIVQDDVDAILFLNQNVTIKEEKQGFDKKRSQADGGGTRNVHCEGRPAFTAKNRYGLPAQFIYRKGHGYEEIAKCLPDASANVSADEPAQDAA